ncbi:MAG TPA: VaFE repeat-containing surface-anchored protein [Candidatus Eubacterium faecigallinarum]|nr:VaFE repeat-containing surface-anchored protein [Candidatus Eubacterium faecigallinarum]
MKKIKKIKPRRLVSVFLALLVVLSTMMPAMTSFASVEQCKLNIRTSTNYKYMNNWAYPNARNGIHLATVADGEHKGEVAYCIEFGKDMGDTGQKETVMDIEDVPAWQDFNATQKRGITYATIYGYPNFTYGVSNEAAQVATQFVVWEYSQGYRTSADGNNPTAGLNGTSSKIENAIEAAGFDVRRQYYDSGVVVYDDVMTAYKGILNGIKTHRTTPTFRNDTVELKWSNSNNRYEAKVTDSNGVLANFAITSGNSNLKFSKSGNTLTIYSASAINSATTVTMMKTCTTVGADIGFVPDDQDYNQSLVGRLTDPVTATFKVKTATGNAQIIKTSEDGEIEGLKFTISGNGLTYSGVTDSKGVFLKENIPAGTYTVTEESIDKYVPQKSQTVTVRGGETATVNFDNILKKFRVKVIKSDIEEGTAQGDASLAGATYGLFKGDELIDTYVTDSNASFTTDYYVCDTDWTLRELDASEGYLLDSTVYKVGADPKLYTIEYNTTNNEVKEQVIKGNIAIIKHTDDGSTQIETPEKGAEFQLYLKSAGSFVNADEDERDTIVCDEDGFASSKLLPYGVYTVHQTKGWDGREKIKDFDVFINSDGKTYKFLINNSNFESYVKVVKLDAETGKQIAYSGAGFEIYDSEGHRVTMQFTYPEVTSIHTFYTNSEGYLITPETLPYGDYTLVEVEAPYGYVLDSTPIPFSITQENSSTDTGVTVVKVKAKDMPQKGTIEIGKSGEVFYSVGVLGGGYVDENGNEVTFPITYQPIYEVKGLPNTVFQIYAAEDITTLDGTVRAYQGELVDEITTDKDGKAKSKELYLGKYTVIEKTATEGFYNPNEQYDVELTYAGQNVSVTSTALSLYNERQKVTISLAKELEQDETFGIGMNDEIKNVQFGIYANEDITALDGSVIPKDALITYASCDENGNINFSCDLPIGFKWYAKEIATDEHYVLSDEKKEFNTEYQGQEVQTIEIAVNDGEPIANELIYGTVKGIKTDRETGKTIEGAVFGLFRSDETEFTEENAVLTAESDKDGIFTFDNVPYGEWIVKELHPAENYLPSDDIHHITVSEDEQIIEINAVNDMIPELKTTASIDGEKEVEVQDKITIDDIVEYKHLVPGKEYIIKGVLMNKATNKPFTVDGKEITSEVSFVPEKPNGEVKVSFTFDASGITENTEIVVFETLYLDGTELAAHADIEDEGQTVTITVPVPETPDTGDNRNYGVWIGLAAIALGAAVSAVIIKIRIKKQEDDEC